ncbi:MAG: hypothetical protein Kow0042_21680 [Calditrichia bacterium]
MIAFKFMSGKPQKKLFLPFLFLITCFLRPPLLFAQTAEIHGKVVDENQQPLPAANVYLSGTVLGSATSSSGEFYIKNVPPGEFTLVITVIGYNQKNLKMRVEESRLYELGTIALNPSPLTGEQVVVTATKYWQNVQDVPVSMATLTRGELRSRNTITLDQALRYVSGVNMASNQVNIRGSSGYSMGTGSRVLFLLDGIPFLTGDTREINYETIPIYLVDHVEVLKGAGSALYGSSALGGVINIITHDIDQTPRYYAKVYAGMYAEPGHEEWKWTENDQYLSGASFSFSRRLGEVGSPSNWGKVGIQLGGARDVDDSYRQNNWRRRWSGSGKVQWDINSFQRLTIAGNYMTQKRGNFLFWRDLNHPLLAGPGQEDDWVESTRSYVTTHYRNILGENKYLTVRGIWFRNRFEDTVSEGGRNVSFSQNVNGELQYNTQLGTTLITTGFEGSAQMAESDLFGDHEGWGAAVYLQAEKKFNSRWQTTLGARMDYFDMSSMESGFSINPKFGLVYRPMAATAIRTSVGLGFRAPSMAEAFTSTVTSGVRVIPNLELKPEKSVYTELGWNQYLSRYLVADAAAFYSHFTDLIEGTFLESSEIQFQNITRARVLGVETNVNGRILNNFLNFSVGYTYVDSRDLDTDEYLNFRPRHLFQSNLAINWRFLRLSTDYRFVSRWDRIDEKFLIIVNNADKRVPIHVVDMQVIAKFHFTGIPFQSSFQINNLLDYNYVDMVGSLAPMRHYIVTLEVGL